MIAQSQCHLVATDMDILRRKYLDNLTDDILDKGIVALLRNTPRIAQVTTTPRLLIGGVVTEDVGADLRQSTTMAREIYLGYHLDIALGSVGHDITQLLVGVVAAPPLIELAVARPHLRIATTEAAFESELGVRLYLDTPTLIVGEMKVELIEFVHRHKVDISFHALNRYKGTSHIEVRTSILKARCILNLHAADLQRQLRTLQIYRRHHLQERLHTIKYTAIATALDGDTLGVNLKFVGLCCKVVVEREFYAILLLLALMRQWDILQKVVRHALELRIVAERCHGVNLELALSRNYLVRLRDNSVGRKRLHKILRGATANARKERSCKN